MLVKQAQEALTHKWTLYVRGANGQNLSFCIKKVLRCQFDSYLPQLSEIRLDAKSIRRSCIRVLDCHPALQLRIIDLIIIDLSIIDLSIVD